MSARDRVVARFVIALIEMDGDRRRLSSVTRDALEKETRDALAKMVRRHLNRRY